MNYKRRRIATFDLGSNSFLLLVAERSEEGRIKVLLDDSLTPRIGEGSRESRWISAAPLERAEEALRTLALKAKDAGAEEFFAGATSAVREASNQEEVLARLSAAAGFPVEVMEASEEARLTYLSVTLEQPHNERTLVVDIGGGSTEITWGIGGRFDGGRSLDLGTVKLLEANLPLEEARRAIDRQLERITPLGKLDRYYGTAGAFTLLASVDMGLERYSPERISGHSLSRSRLSQWVERLSAMTMEERGLLPGSDPRRVDLLLPGALIAERLQAKFGNDSFEISDRGVRFGKLFDLLRGFVPPIIW
jgi:exopolyphosphatase/guanosine-5'-triphosphate,3'-diphosphate pyrophosphatase